MLVIDDEPLIRVALAEGLTDGGFDVRLAATGAEARRSLTASAGEPVIVLLDMRLPDVADLSLLREIRLRWPAAPVIVITAHGSAGDESDAASGSSARRPRHDRPERDPAACPGGRHILWPSPAAYTGSRVRTPCARRRRRTAGPLVARRTAA